MKTLQEIDNPAEKRVLVRVDFNVSLKDGEVLDDRKIKASIPTIEYLISEGAKVILVTHLGRPQGELEENLRVDPLSKKLSELLGENIRKLDDFAGKEVEQEVADMKSGEIIMLENIRFSPDEKKNSGKLAQDLANLADVFVLDGFGVVHRDHSSVSGVAKLLPSFAGLLLKKEVENLNKVMVDPLQPLCLVLGGIKVSTKLPVIKSFLADADSIMIGGGLLNTYLASLGKQIRESVYEKDKKEQAKQLFSSEKVVKPKDVRVGTENGSRSRVVPIEKKEICRKGEAVFDIGPETIEEYQNYINKSKTLIYNGAMGYFEQEPYQEGTCRVLESVIKTSKKENTFSVVGGGETVQSLSLVDGAENIDHISTGGGAMLSYLSGERLAGLESLE